MAAYHCYCYWLSALNQYLHLPQKEELLRLFPSLSSLIPLSHIHDACFSTAKKENILTVRTKQVEDEHCLCTQNILTSTAKFTLEAMPSVPVWVRVQKTPADHSRFLWHRTKIWARDTECWEGAVSRENNHEHKIRPESWERSKDQMPWAPKNSDPLRLFT